MHLLLLLLLFMFLHLRISETLIGCRLLNFRLPSRHLDLSSTVHLLILAALVHAE